MHIAKLWPLGATKIVIGKHTQLTIAIRMVPPFLRVGEQNLAASGIMYLVCFPFVTFWGTLVANEVNKNLSYKFVGSKKAVAPCPYLTMCLKISTRQIQLLQLLTTDININFNIHTYFI